MEPTATKQDSQDTQLTTDPNRTKMVKIRALRDIRLANGTILAANNEADVSEEQAKEFCDTSYPGYPQHSGDRTSKEIDPKESRVVRAVRL